MSGWRETRLDRSSVFNAAKPLFRSLVPRPLAWTVNEPLVWPAPAAPANTPESETWLVPPAVIVPHASPADAFRAETSMRAFVLWLMPPSAFNTTSPPQPSLLWPEIDVVCPDRSSLDPSPSAIEPAAFMTSRPLGNTIAVLLVIFAPDRVSAAPHPCAAPGAAALPPGPIDRSPPAVTAMTDPGAPVSSGVVNVRAPPVPGVRNTDREPRLFPAMLWLAVSDTLSKPMICRSSETAFDGRSWGP